MNEIIATVLEFLETLPVWAWGAGGVGLLLIIILAVSGGRRARILKAALKNLEENEPDPELAKKLLKHRALLKRLIREKGDEVIAHFDIAEHLIRQLSGRRKNEIARRLLHLAPEQGAFPVFLAALKKESVANIFREWIGEEKEILLFRRMALGARGRDFDGPSALALLSPILESVREFSGDPEWPVRFFALRVLLADPDPKSFRMIREAFRDPHPLVRRTVAAEAELTGPDELFGALLEMVLDDPVIEVRRAARDRIEAAFPDRWKLDPSGMDARQAVHVLELLKIGSNDDENVAVVALQGKNAEARLAAARFLEKSGTLERILLGATRGDLEDWERRRSLLSGAISVGVDIFLREVGTTDSVDVLLLGAHLLSEGGSVHLIPPLVDKAFSRTDPAGSADEGEFYRVAATLACSRGDERSRALVRNELRRRRNDPDVLSFILPLLPPEDAPAYRDVILEFLRDPEFTAEEAFGDLMSRLPPSLFLGPVLDILESSRAQHGHAVRLRALRCLGGWHLDFTMQTVLENLPILHREEARDFAKHLEGMDTELLKERAVYIMDSPDAGVRAALIACLPSGAVSSFSREIREGLNDADPEVRIACLQALFDSGMLKATDSALALLRDPVERVRREAARLAGRKATDKFLKALETVLNADDESPVVRIAALDGLSVSPAKESVDTLVRFLNEGEDLREELQTAMAAKTDKSAVAALVEQFKDAEAVLRDKISDVFAAMGEAGEEALVTLLREDIATLKPFLADILTRTGYVETLIRRLGHRKPEIRREAAGILASIGTESAYRGVVLAARDPDQEVRVQVTKALESLASPEGEAILKSLEQDPDRKVRRYTHWAMERLRAKKLP